MSSNLEGLLSFTVSAIAASTQFSLVSMVDNVESLLNTSSYFLPEASFSLARASLNFTSMLFILFSPWPQAVLLSSVAKTLFTIRAGTPTQSETQALVVCVPSCEQPQESIPTQTRGDCEALTFPPHPTEVPSQSQTFAVLLHRAVCVPASLVANLHQPQRSLRLREYQGQRDAYCLRLSPHGSRYISNTPPLGPSTIFNHGSSSFANP